MQVHVAFLRGIMLHSRLLGAWIGIWKWRFKRFGHLVMILIWDDGPADAGHHSNGCCKQIAALEAASNNFTACHTG